MMVDGLPLVIVMPGLIYGPGDTSSLRTTLVQYLQRQLPMIPKETAFCWACVDDIAQAHILAMERGKPQETYIIAGEKHTLAAAMQIAEEITGIPQPMSVPPVIFQIMSNLVGLVDRWVPIPPAYAAESLRILAGVTYIGDNSKAKRNLGYNPRSLKVGLTETLNAEMKLLNL
jgi:nucleoside-diphosphate-sugar epimerase